MADSMKMLTPSDAKLTGRRLLRTSRGRILQRFSCGGRARSVQGDGRKPQGISHLEEGQVGGCGLRRASVTGHGDARHGRGRRGFRRKICHMPVPPSENGFPRPRRGLLPPSKRS